MVGTEHNRKVAVLNNSGRPVHIERLLASCGCITVVASDETIPDGETVMINISLTVQGKGSSEFAVQVLFREPIDPVSVSLVVEGVEGINVIPSSVYVGEIPRGMPYEEHFSLQVSGLADDKNPIRVLAESQNQSYNAVLGSAVARSSSIRLPLLFQSDGEAAEGRFEYVCRLTAGGSKKTVFPVSFLGVVVDPVVASCRQLTFGSEREKFVDVSSKFGDICIKKVEVDRNLFSIDVIINSGSNIRLRIAKISEAPPQEESELLIEFESPVSHSLEIPIFAN